MEELISMSGLYATRAAQVNATFVKLADTLVSDFDVVDLLDRLVRTCVDVLQAKAAGLLLLDKGGHLRVMASSNEDMRLLELLELLNDDGPSVACFRTGAAVSVSNLSVLAEEWPTFVPAALTAGFRSVHALPLRLRDDTIGALNLLTGQGDELTDAELATAQALADVATIGILQQRAVQRAELLAEQLQSALSSRVVIEQAKGVLAERGAVAVDAAFDLMRNYSRANNLRISEVAREIVHGQGAATRILRQG
jgi:GAF domain-containing protein